MDSFYYIILAIAILILILVLAVIGWMMTENVKTQEFPGVTTTCPDFWTVTTDAGKQMCVRPDLGKRNRGSDDLIADGATPGWNDTINGFDTNAAGWSSSGDAICAKKAWAIKYGINWDTINSKNCA